MHMNREMNNLKSELEEQERDADDVLKKYQNHVQNVKELIISIFENFIEDYYNIFLWITQVHIGLVSIYRLEQSDRLVDSRESTA